MITVRAQFAAAVVATLFGILVVVGYGMHALRQVGAAGDRVARDLDLLATTAEVEDTVREAGARRDPAEAAPLLLELDTCIERLRRLANDPDEADHVRRFEQCVAAARARPSAEAWFQAGEVIGDFEKDLIGRTQRTDEGQKAKERAGRMLGIGAGVVALFAAAAALVFVRWRRAEREAQERLRRSDRLAALGTIAASVAHEINNPLATISGCASAVRDRMKRQPDACPDSLEYLEMIEDESRRCSSILKSLRDLARDGPPAMAEVDLVRIARSVVALLEVDRRARRVVYAIEGEDALPAICDPDKLKQLLLNLLINAREASAEGGRVTLAVLRSGPGTARIEVADEGRGIETRDLERIFEPFHTDKTQGLGIGLFLCERIAALHGGTIRAQSAGRGRGARFVVELPTHSAPAPTGEVNVPASQAS